MECPEDNKKSKDALGDEGDSPNLFGRNIARMRVEDAWPDIKEGTKTKQNKRSGTDPARDVVYGNPADMVIPGGNITSGLCVPAGFEHDRADGSFPVRHILGVILVTTPQPSSLVHELRDIYFLDISSEIVGGFCGHEDFAVPFAREGGKGSLNRKGEMKELSLAKNEKCQQSADQREA